LDSTIVLSILASQKNAQTIQVMHQCVDGAGRSEVDFARLAARRYGFNLDEVHFTSQANLPERSAHPLSIRPYRELLLANMIRAAAPGSSERASPLFTGQGGDHLFFAQRSVYGFCDSLQTPALRREVLRSLYWSAKLSNKSIWSVLASAISASLRTESRDKLAQGARSSATPMNAHLFEQLDLSDFFPSWAVDAGRLPPGKFEHVSSLAHLFMARQNIERPYAANVLDPLISQPLIELCLSIPVSILSLNGVSRGLAREAFRSDLPEAICQRVTKGETSRFSIEVILKNMDTLISALKNGELSKLGLLNTEEGSLLNVDDATSHRSAYRLLYYYIIESWFSRWRTQLSPR
jgi:asparagine synthase (glutamine-hydrolysing)